jgi:hypothetical protein
MKSMSPSMYERWMNVRGGRCGSEAARKNVSWKPSRRTFSEVRLIGILELQRHGLHLVRMVPAGLVVRVLDREIRRLEGATPRHGRLPYR